MKMNAIASIGLALTLFATENLAGEEKVSIDFKGGNPEELIKVLEGATGKRPNLIILPQVREISLPPIQLGSVSADQVFQALNHILQGSNEGKPNVAFSQIVDPSLWVLSKAPAGVDPTTGMALPEGVLPQ